MFMKKNNKRNIVIMGIVIAIIVIVMGGTLAYWMWISDDTQKTEVAFSIGTNFSCSADGGGNIIGANLEPTTDCTNGISTKVIVTPTIPTSDLTIKMDLWLKVNELGPNLSKSKNLKYAITKTEGNCTRGTSGYVNGGSFQGLNVGDVANLFGGREYKGPNSDSEEYWLYIWLDAEETDNKTQGENFNFSLGGECTDLPAPEAPVLDDAMIPVVIDDYGRVTTVSANDPDWYNYSEKKWANVVLVKENVTGGVTGSKSRSYYLSNLSNNVSVAEEDILEYYVWIPKFKYRISNSVTCGDLENANLTDNPECYDEPYIILISKEEVLDKIIDIMLEWGMYDDRESSLPAAQEAYEELLTTGYVGEIDSYVYDLLSEDEYTYTFQENKIVGTLGPTSIDIIFESKDNIKALGDAKNTYYSHPAFIDNGSTLSGFWMGKFETTNDVVLTGEYDEGIELEKRYLKVLPNKGNSVSFYDYTTSEGGRIRHATFIRDNGLNSGLLDISHEQWGAVAYLSHSKYGINKEVRINNYYNQSIKTGCGAAADNASKSEECAIPYGNGALSYPQSTTGNITGVFDMSGGMEEFTLGNFNYVSNLGMSLSETSFWYSDLLEISDGTEISDFFVRGGTYNSGTSAGLFAIKDSNNGYMRNTVNVTR